MFQSSASFVSTEFQTLLESHWLLMANWKWLALVGATFLIVFLNKFSRIFIYKLKKKITLADSKTFISYFIQQNIEKAISWIFAAFIGMLIIENLDLTVRLEKYFLLVLKLTLSLHVLRLAYFAAEASGLLIDTVSKKSQSQLSDQLAPLATKTLRVLVVIVGSLLILDNFGVNVTALLAGLGIGGVALAFAAQDTVANVFGTITILFDSPFKIGDRIKIGDTEGLVEEVGFRSTRIRTFHNSLVTIPNSVIAKEKIDNISERKGVFRFRHTFGFTYSTSIEKLEGYCENVRYYLKQDERVLHDNILIQMTDLGESSVNILVNFHFVLAEADNEAAYLHKYLMDLYRLSQNLKLNLAFPTRTIYLEKETLTEI